MSQVYTSPDDACRDSRMGWASSDPFRILTPSHPAGVLACIKWGDGSPHFVYYASPGIRVHDRKPTSAEVESQKRWRAW